MFAILGMNLLSEKLGYCEGSPTIYGFGQERVKKNYIFPLIFKILVYC